MVEVALDILVVVELEVIELLVMDLHLYKELKLEFNLVHTLLQLVQVELVVVVKEVMEQVEEEILLHLI